MGRPKDKVKVTLEFMPNDWLELASAIRTKAACVARGDYDAVDTDPDDSVQWARQLNRIYKTVGRELTKKRVTV
jgi:hypothetical protein